MKLLVEISDEKAGFFMELLKNLGFVKAKALTPDQARVLDQTREAVKEVNEIKVGSKKSQSLTDVLDEV